jgi:putative DNA primase/helicase
VKLEDVAAHSLFSGKISWPHPLDAALTYAGRGWLVFPCHSIQAGRCSCSNPDCPSPGKHPLTRNGVKDATANPALIQAWFGNWPTANIGLSCVGRVVLDSDRDHGGEESIRKLAETYGALPQTLTCLTGGGGRHLHFASDEKFTNTVSWLPGVDIRSEGAYVLVPQSSHRSGRTYEWLDYGVEPAPLPEWLRLLLVKPLEKKAQPQNGTEPGAKIPEGQRRQDALSRAGAMRRKGFSSSAIYSALIADNAARYEPPLSEEELRALAYDIEKRYEPAATLSPEETPGRVLVTELSNAERLLAKYASDLRFAADRQIWVGWNGRFWAVDDVAGALRLVGQVCRNIYLEAGSQPTQDLREAFASWRKNRKRTASKRIVSRWHASTSASRCASSRMFSTGSPRC